MFIVGRRSEVSVFVGSMLYHFCRSLVRLRSGAEVSDASDGPWREWYVSCGRVDLYVCPVSYRHRPVGDMVDMVVVDRGHLVVFAHPSSCHRRPVDGKMAVGVVDRGRLDVYRVKTWMTILSCVEW